MTAPASSSSSSGHGCVWHEVAGHLVYGVPAQPKPAPRVGRNLFGVPDQPWWVVAPLYVLTLGVQIVVVLIWVEAR